MHPKLRLGDCHQLTSYWAADVNTHTQYKAKHYVVTLKDPEKFRATARLKFYIATKKSYVSLPGIQESQHMIRLLRGFNSINELYAYFRKAKKWPWEQIRMTFYEIPK